MRCFFQIKKKDDGDCNQHNFTLRELPAFIKYTSSSYEVRSAVFAMDDMDEIFLRVLDSAQLFLFWNNIDIGEQHNENIIQWQSHVSNKRNPLKEMFVYSN